MLAGGAGQAIGSGTAIHCIKRWLQAWWLHRACLLIWLYCDKLGCHSIVAAVGGVVRRLRHSMMA